MTPDSTRTATETEIEAGCGAVADTFDRASDLQRIADALLPASRYYLLGCGSSYWASVVAESLFRERGLDARAVAASSFALESFPTDEETVAIGVSQSGETTETVRALETAADRGARTLAITNATESSLAAAADEAFVTPAGEETSVLATKSVSSALAAASFLAGAFAQAPSVPAWDVEPCERVAAADYEPAVEALVDADHAYAIGLGLDYGLAGEAAVKFGEGPLLHTTPLQAMEISHGPRANVADDPVLVVASDPATIGRYEPVLADLHDAGAQLVGIHPETVSPWVDVSVPVPETEPQWLAVLAAIQRLTLQVALARDLDPDDPPTLSKHVERPEW